MPSNTVEPQGPMTSLRGLAAGVIFLVIVLAVLVFIGTKAGRGSAQPPVPPIAPGESVTGASPVPIAPLTDSGQKSELVAYFARVSANFAEEFMVDVPAEAGLAFEQYTAATDGAKKLEKARNFFIYLNNPNVDRNDSAQVAFLADVKADLEKAVGQPLF